MHRTTRWRWKTKGRPTKRTLTKRGRRLCIEPLKHKTLQFAALLIEDKVPGSGFVDHVKILKEARERIERPEFDDVFSEIARWDEFPVDLIAVATCDALQIGTRTRRRSSFLWTDDQTTRRLMKKCPQLSEQEARTEIAKWKLGDAEWIEAFLNQTDDRHRTGQGSTHQCCVSKIKGFQHISRRMASYWRRHDNYLLCMSLIHELVRRREDKRLKGAAVSSKRPSPPRSSVASAQSRTTPRRRARRPAPGSC
jgi:hypothetical protein